MSSVSASRNARPSFEFSPLAPDEIEAAIDIFVPAFQTELKNELFPGRHSDPEGYRDHLRRNMFDLKNAPNYKFYGKTTRADTGEMVSIGIWSHYRADWVQTGQGKDKEERPEDRWSGINRPSLDAFFNQERAVRERIMDGREHIHIFVLGTKLSYQGQGAISPIIRHVLAEADAAHVPVHIEASPRGLPVYIHFGWKTVETFTVGRATGTVLVREPR